MIYRFFTIVAEYIYSNLTKKHHKNYIMFINSMCDQLCEILKISIIK